MPRTLSDMMRNVGLDPAWQSAPETQQPPRQQPRRLRPPEERVNDRDPYVRQSARRELSRRGRAIEATDAHQLYDRPTPVTWKEAGDKLLEFTGLPSVRRAAFHVGNSLINHENEWGDAAWEAGNAALMLAPAFEATRAMTAPAAAEARLGVMPPEAPPTPPPHYVGPNGMPIAPAQPFRNSLRYGSEDLADAAAMRSEPSPAPSVGAASGEQMQRAPEAGQAAAEQSGRLSENQIEEAIDRRHGRGVSRGAERTVPTANFMPTLDQLIPDPYAAELESDAILRTFNAHAREELRTGRLAQEVEIPIADLVAVQSRVRTNYADSLEHARGDLPEVLYRNGRYYLVEGHNRVAAMAARGDTQVRVRAFGRNEGRTRAAPDAGQALAEQATHAPDGNSSDTLRGLTPYIATPAAWAALERARRHADRQHRDTQARREPGFSLPRRTN